mgnify:CR=1 FL=1
MNLVKLNLLVVSLSSLAGALLLIWNTDSLNYGSFIWNSVETLLIIVSVFTMKEQTKISWKL